jgi:hypothetical protein
MASAAHSSVWPAAASPLLAAELAAAPRGARVLAAFPTALYLLLDRHDLVLPVLADDALRLPTGLRLGLPSRSFDWGVAPGDEVLVGDGRVRLPHRDVVAVREWRPARVAPGPSRASSAGMTIATTRSALAAADVSGLLRDLADPASGGVSRGCRVRPDAERRRRAVRRPAGVARGRWRRGRRGCGIRGRRRP